MRLIAAAGTAAEAALRRLPDAWRHVFAFGLCGVAATLTDMGLFAALHGGLGWSEPVARLPAIAAAVLVGWRAHRRFTFRVRSAPSWRELARYAGVAWVSIAVNYGVFVALVAAMPHRAPLGLIVLSSGVAMAVSYLGMRFGVFRRVRPAATESVN